MSAAVRRLFAEIVDGFRVGMDVLWWGQSYPTRLDQATIDRMTKAARKHPGSST